MSKVFVLDTEKRPLNPIHPAQARQLLRNGKAAVFKKFPFTIILKVTFKTEKPVQPLRLKIDPGAQTTGLMDFQFVTVVENKFILDFKLGT